MKYNFFVISIRKYLFSFIFLLFLVSLILFSSSNLIAAKEGISLWALSVVPSLFPFFVASDLLCQTNLIFLAGKYLGKFMRPIFHVPGESAVAMIIGTISGYPVGAKIVCKLLEDGKCNSEEAERLLAFCNNSGPLFILGTVGISLFANASIGFLLLASHILASLSVGFLYRFWSPNTRNKKNLALTKNVNSSRDNISSVNLQNLGEVLGNSIKSAISSIFLVGGFVVLFSVVLSILNSYNIFNFFSPLNELLHLPDNFLEAFFSGCIELTNGLKSLSVLEVRNINISIIFSSFLLGFGGISILLQVFSIIAKHNLSIKPYLIGKLFQGIFSCFYSFLFLSFFPFHLNF